MRNLFLALLSGILLAFSWPAIGIFPLVFFAFVPLFILEKETTSGKQIFFYSFLAFLVFNTITTYWVYHATFFGAIAAFIINAFLMATAFFLFHKVKNRITNRVGYISFITIWIAMEFLHLNWDLSWPWLTLGNVFANHPSIIQWYEFTGFLGGSFWVLTINLLLFWIVIAKEKRKCILMCLGFFLFPMAVSYYLFFDTNNENNEKLNVVIVQPNIDPYTEKFKIGFKKQLDDFIALSKTKLSKETHLLLGPETAFLEGIWENKIEATLSVRKFRELQKEFPNLNILIGASTYRMFGHGEQTTSTARQIRNENVYYDAYNSAIFIPDSGEVEVYHKTKLVPGAENMPFPKLLDPLAKLVVSLGGTSGSLGKENYNNSFIIDDKVINPLICYESIYGDMQSDNSDLIAIITNDGWWKNTAGHKQHFSYASFRAIEQRKTIVRSANTGISGVINQKGVVLQQSKWNEAICLSATINTI
ncbi:apolipoprotein N-acyltransferase, partial [Flavobacteriales bacterium]|nr:apolipoprotein N-acyltransferase [Flavobacteriales bacterium]